MTLTDQLAALDYGSILTAHITVTPEDVRTGAARDCWRCPVSLALRRIFPRLVPRIYTFQAYLYAPDEDGLFRMAARASLPESLETLIRHVDKNETGYLLVPSSFTLEFLKIRMGIRAWISPEISGIPENEHAGY